MVDYTTDNITQFVYNILGATLKALADNAQLLVLIGIFTAILGGIAAIFYMVRTWGHGGRHR